MRHISWIFFLTLAAACTGDADKDTTDDKDTTGDDDDDTTAFAPMSGSWNVNAQTVLDNACNTPEPEAYVAELQVNGNTATLTEDTGDVFDCVIDGYDMVCTSNLLIEDASIDLSVTGIGTISGTFTDERTFPFTTTVELACEGAGCEAFATEIGATLPCTSTFEGQATHGS